MREICELSSCRYRAASGARQYNGCVQAIPDAGVSWRAATRASPAAAARALGVRCEVFVTPSAARKQAKLRESCRWLVTGTRMRTRWRRHRQEAQTGGCSRTLRPPEVWRGGNAGDEIEQQGGRPPTHDVAWAAGLIAASRTGRGPQPRRRTQPALATTLYARGKPAPPVAVASRHRGRFALARRVGAIAWGVDAAFVKDAVPRPTKR